MPCSLRFPQSLTAMHAHYGPYTQQEKQWRVHAQSQQQRPPDEGAGWRRKNKERKRRWYDRCSRLLLLAQHTNTHTHLFINVQ